MQRYFIDRESLDETIRITAETIHHHVANVMRMQPGEQFVLCDLHGRCHLVELTSIAADALHVRRLYRVRTASHKLHITLGLSLIRKEPFERTLQKAAELGVESVLPLEAARCVVRLGAKRERKGERFRRILQEAAEQCHRDQPPTLAAPSPLSAVDFSAYDVVLLPYEEETAVHMRQAVKSIEDGMDVLVLIGPEGGFTAEEVQAATDHGARRVSLGPRILRSDTAALYALSVLSYEFEGVAG